MRRRDCGLKVQGWVCGRADARLDWKDPLLHIPPFFVRCPGHADRSSEARVPAQRHAVRRSARWLRER